MQNEVYACFDCRIAFKNMTVCTRCGVTAVYMGTKWRAPKSTKLKAWQMVAQGDIWWDRSARAKCERVQRDERLKDYWESIKRRVTPKKK